MVPRHNNQTEYKKIVWAREFRENAVFFSLQDFSTSPMSTSHHPSLFISLPLAPIPVLRVE